MSGASRQQTREERETQKGDRREQRRERGALRRNKTPLPKRGFLSVCECVSARARVCAGPAGFISGPLFPILKLVRTKLLPSFRRGLRADGGIFGGGQVSIARRREAATVGRCRRTKKMTLWPSTLDNFFRFAPSFSLLVFSFLIFFFLRSSLRLNRTATYIQNADTLIFERRRA